MRNKYLKDTKKRIESYDRWCTQLELRKKELEFIEEQCDGNRTNIIELNDMKNKEYLEKEIRRLTLDIESVHRGLSHLDKLEYKIIELKHKKKDSWVSVAFDTGYSVSRCKEIGKIAIMIVGEAVHGTIVHQDLPLCSGEGCY